VGDKAQDASRDGNGQAAASPRKLSPGPGLAPKQVAAHQLARIHEAATGIVAGQGYQALKVRDVVRHAGVSTRAFYEHFGSKGDCLLQTHDLIARRATRRLIAAQAGERDWRRRPRLVFEELVRQLEQEPDAARFTLIEAYAADDASLAQAWRAERIFEGMLLEAFARAPAGVAIPPMIVEGMVAGIASVARNRLFAGKVSSLSDSSDQLIEWALLHIDPVAARLAELDRQTVWRDTTLQASSSPSLNGDMEAWPTTGDRALILCAVAELAATKGYAGLTAARIRSAAHVSRRKFNAYFDDVEDCYLAVLEQRVGEATAQAVRAQTAASSPPGGVYRAIATLCDHVAGNPFLARVCLTTDDFPPGLNGARSRRRLIEVVTELLQGATPQAVAPSPLTIEASTGAIWSLFHRHIIRDWSLRRQISATLSYMVLAPVVGASTTVASIGSEQSA
jgi:AcrR family transcriptional regulator